MSSLAEKLLQTTTYTGEKRRWTFERYVKVHIDQHSILEGLVQHGYSGIDSRSKVRHLVDGIKTTTLDPVKTRILSDATLRSDFDACVNLFQDFIKQSASTDIRSAQISEIQTHTQDGQSCDLSVADRYYTTNEYNKLTAAQKLG